MSKRFHTKTLCIYSGCGGLDLGFSRAGYSIEKAIDNNRFAVATHQKNMPGISTKGDLTQPIDFGSSKYDVVIGGPPCQGFSLAGRRREDDPRNNHIARFIDIAVSVSPKLIVMENVPGLMYGSLKRHHSQANEILRANGFQTETIKFDTSEFGVPQHRRRVLLIAWKNTLSEVNIAGNYKFKQVKVHEALANLTESTSDHKTQPLSPSSKDFLIARKIGAGMKLSNVRAGDRNVHTWSIPEVFGSTTQVERDVLNAILRIRRLERRRDLGDADPVTIASLTKFLGYSTQTIVNTLIQKRYIRRLDRKYIDLTNTFNGKYRRLRLDDVSYTVDTYFGNPKYFLHPTEHRGLSVREAARLQTFPDTFNFIGSDIEKYKMIGNAVPPLFAQSIAEQLRNLVSE